MKNHVYVMLTRFAVYLDTLHTDEGDTCLGLPNTDVLATVIDSDGPVYAGKVILSGTNMGIETCIVGVEPEFLGNLELITLHSALNNSVPLTTLVGNNVIGATFLINLNAGGRNGIEG
ncbi:hypothetical protein FIN92_09645 [Prevotella brunnea]|uniref:hypothetical protein n=1 Tax=Prevotella brunnea TaxID=2508867 RepID=UPI0028234D3D|nr:hypothetical protein [Prevotella brunnea]MDR0186819.1 hypothetical protein [Prevotella brunnea]